MEQALAAGAVLGLAAGLSPGPLLALVLAQTLRHGFIEGAKTAAAPLVTDIPIILLSLVVVGEAARLFLLLPVIGSIGGVYVLYLGWSTLRGQAPEVDEGAPPAPRSLIRGTLVNALSPHPWLFWLTVGGPTMVRARGSGLAAPIAFTTLFLALLVGSKVVLAALVARFRTALSGRAYPWTLRVLGLLLGLFGLGLLWESGQAFRDALR
jgi:threonine/homoserine/homoserine lactone efflux protein